MMILFKIAALLIIVGLVLKRMQYNMIKGVLTSSNPVKTTHIAYSLKPWINLILGGGSILFIIGVILFIIKI